MSEVDIYLNPKQEQILDAPQKTKVGVIGRGGGKTTLFGDILYEHFHQMPGSKGFLLLKTFGQAYTKSLPEVFDRLSKYGMKEHVGNTDPGHYTVCVKPPKWWGKPFKKPKKYDNSVTWINGMMMDILSFDRPDLNRGGSYDWGLVDEAALIKYEEYTKTIRPLLRGNIKDWDHPRRFSMYIFTSRAWKSSGKWTETKMKQLAAEHPDKYFYTEASAAENIEVLGQEYFERIKLELDPITYSVEIENKPISKLPNAYYQDLDDERHLYDPEYDYEYQDSGSWKITGEKDVNQKLPLEPSFDFNAAFSSATIWQDHRVAPTTDSDEKFETQILNELRCVKNFFVRFGSVEDLVHQICDHYEDHPTKEVNIFGGKDGLSKFKLYNDLTLYQRIESTFQQRGWKTTLCVDISLADVAHKQKHLVLNNVLREINPELPKVRINEQNSKETFISMLGAPVKGDFQKDKSSEKDEDLDQAEATHLSDTFDNYVYPKVLTNFVHQTEGSSDDFGVFSG